MSDRIIIRLNPVETFQRLYVHKDGQRVAAMGVTMEDFAETLTALLHKYNIMHIDVSGSRAFSEGIMRNYSQQTGLDFNIEDLEIRYI